VEIIILTLVHWLKNILNASQNTLVINCCGGSGVVPVRVAEVSLFILWIMQPEDLI
jgi:hypothetical protein